VSTSGEFVNKCAYLMRGWRRALVALFLAPYCLPTLAHDVWIEPSTFAPTVGQNVGLRLQVGERLVGEPIPFDPSLVNQFFVVNAGSRRPVIGRTGAEPAGLMRTATPGLHVVGYRSNRSRIELPPEKFHDYLKEEGLEAIIAERGRRNELNATGRELYSRCVKSLLLVGSPSATQIDQPLGFTLELVAERNPYLLGSDENLPVRLLYESRPLPGALVVALNTLDPTKTQSMRTDKEGRVQFKTTPGGMWLIKAVHMVNAPPGSNAEWESFWASLTFGQRGVTEGKSVEG
jgi:uncharacterized GH25 family protein